MIAKDGTVANVGVIYHNSCDDGFIWNPRTCECECGKSCVAGKYLDHINCKCRKILIDRLVEVCEEDQMVKDLVIDHGFNPTKTDSLCINDKSYQRFCVAYIILLFTACLFIVAIMACICIYYPCIGKYSLNINATSY